MKTTIKLTVLSAVLLLAVLPKTTQGQSEPTSPHAKADMKLVSDYVKSLVSGNLDKAKTLMADNYKGYGPTSTDSATVEQVISEWKENYKRQSNRKVSFVTQSFHVRSGNLKGDWVSLWGDYSFTENGREVKFPFQYTARVTNGKINTDRIYYDRLYVLEILGYQVTPPEGNK